MVGITLEENEIDTILKLINRKIEKINKKEIDENQIQTKKEYEDLKNHILIQIE